MRQYIVALLAVLLVACGDNPTNPPESTGDQLRVINGPATCNACDHVEFTVAGPGLSTVTDASLKNHATGADIETTAEIRHFVGEKEDLFRMRLRQVEHRLVAMTLGFQPVRLAVERGRLNHG